MDKKILVVGEKESFIGRAICDNLKGNKFEVLSEEADVTKISKLPNIPDLIFVNMEENTKENSELMIYLRDLAIEHDKLLFFTGYAADISEVVDKMPGSIIGGRFNRPVNTKSVGEAILKITESEAALNKKHILVVDDDGTMLRAIKGWLDGRYKVSIVNSGTNAMTFLGTNKPDLILLDYEMPILSGPQLLEMIRSESTLSAIPVIFLTSKGDKESVQKVLALKPQGYLLKSQSPDKIVASIDEFFALNKAKQS